jgi:hypothetical protein
VQPCVHLVFSSPHLIPSSPSPHLISFSSSPSHLLSSPSHLLSSPLHLFIFASLHLLFIFSSPCHLFISPFLLFLISFSSLPLLLLLPSPLPSSPLPPHLFSSHSSSQLLSSSLTSIMICIGKECNYQLKLKERRRDDGELIIYNLHYYTKKAKACYILEGQGEEEKEYDEVVLRFLGS